jgi:4-aminobutyrate aminotransferase-like enzyme
MSNAIHFNNEDQSNSVRDSIASNEPRSLRTFTPSQAVLQKSAGVFHWTPEGRRLFDYSSGVLVTNLGHNSRPWLNRFADYMGWATSDLDGSNDGYAEAVSMTAYNAITPIEAQATERLLNSLHTFPGGSRLQSVMWAASGSEAVQKALWACLHRNESRDIMLATRHGFHGKKGLAGAVTGCEDDHDRDPRVRFISFPMHEVDDMDRYGEDIDLTKYQNELDALHSEFGSRINCLITEPYLGGGGSYHPPAAYMQLLQSFCNKHDIALILDEVQANFGRTGTMYAFEKYGLEPDFVCLGKGLGNGVPVSAAVGRRDICDSLGYGAASDTWSANPFSCAGVLATLDEFETTDVLENTQRLSKQFFAGLAKLKQTAVIQKVRGEGMVFGIECADVGDHAASDVANLIVETAYLGDEGGDGIHLLGPLAEKVIRVSPPMTMTADQAAASLSLLLRICERVSASIMDHPAIKA